MRERKRVTMWRDDHIGDPVGAIFLGIADDAAKRLADYFGDKVRILTVAIVQNQAHLELEYFKMSEESNQLVATARDLRAKGLMRNAQSLLKEALALDPMNADAFMTLGMFLADRREYPGALATLKRAREAGGDRPDLMQALAGVSLKLEQPGIALGYLQRAAELAPNDPAIRRALTSLDRKPPEDPKPPRALDVVHRDRRA